MHRIVWTHGEQVLAWTLSNGSHAVPEIVRAKTGLHALVLVDQWAFGIGNDAVRTIPYDRDLIGDAWRLNIARDTHERPTLFGFERTRHDEPVVPRTFVRFFDDTGLEIEVSDRPVVLGRHRTCHVATVDKRVSLFHCAVMRKGGALVVVDLGSRNGTFIDHARTSCAIVAKHASLRIGRRRYEMRCANAIENISVSKSEAILLLEFQLSRLAPANVTLMVHGESGVGKELVAQRIHALSGRAGKFVALNAAVLTTSLASSELFGHVKGAFTGAEQDRQGAFSEADGGTLFLDEVAELSPSVQAELLRAVELKRIRRVGEVIERPVDVRLVTATHRKLEEMVAAGTFREDLFHRLSGMQLVVPPLRERPEDLTHIVESFLNEQLPVRRLTEGAWNKLRAHTWPGNVRELLNTLKRTCVMCDDELLSANALTFAPSTARAGSLDALIHDAVIAAYEASGGSAAQTARNLGLQRKTVHRLVRASRQEAAAYRWRR
ncbi:MAG: sigma 54-interacting transcriptional regulator [Clostridia bacterium]|nr:sigma 54-interacting transcriptional regulator [Deltaproteobacteria bacterium]